MIRKCVIFPCVSGTSTRDGETLKQTFLCSVVGVSYNYIFSYLHFSNIFYCSGNNFFFKILFLLLTATTFKKKLTMNDVVDHVRETPRVLSNNFFLVVINYSFVKNDFCVCSVTD